MDLRRLALERARTLAQSLTLCTINEAIVGNWIVLRVPDVQRSCCAGLNPAAARAQYQHCTQPGGITQGFTTTEASFPNSVSAQLVLDLENARLLERAANRMHKNLFASTSSRRGTAEAALCPRAFTRTRAALKSAEENSEATLQPCGSPCGCSHKLIHRRYLHSRTDSLVPSLPTRYDSLTATTPPSTPPLRSAPHSAGLRIPAQRPRSALQPLRHSRIRLTRTSTLELTHCLACPLQAP